MKRFFLAFVGMALASTAWAQTTSQVQQLPAPGVVTLWERRSTVVTQTPQASVEQVTGGRILGGASDSAPGCEKACKSACRQPACPPAPACVAVPAWKVTPNITYSSVCTKVCFPKCSSFLSPRGCDSSCDKGSCEARAYQQKYLVKRVSFTECPTTKCEPAAPSCCDGRGVIIHRGGTSAPPVEAIPVKPLPVK